MTKSYLFESLLLLLLIFLNTATLSAYTPRFTPSVGKQLTKWNKGQANHYKWKKMLDKIKVPGPDAQPGRTIQGLSEIKQYFTYFGYLQQHAPFFNDILDNVTISAIKTYQQYFNLQVTGDLNNETLQQISLPRCGVPDMNFEYGFTSTEMSTPKGNMSLFSKGTRNLSYGFAPVNKIQFTLTEVLRNAFTRWSQTTKVLNFSETTYDDADIKIGFYVFDDRVEDVVIGSSFTKKQLSSNVMSGVIQLDGSKYWALPDYNLTWSWKDGEIDLESVAMHQIGHLLGLDHSSHNESIMYPAILPLQQRKVEITDSDNKTIQQLYSNVTKDNTTSGYVGRFTLFGSSYGLVISLSLGFVFMAILN